MRRYPMSSAPSALIPLKRSGFFESRTEA